MARGRAAGPPRQAGEVSVRAEVRVGLQPAVPARVPVEFQPAVPVQGAGPRWGVWRSQNRPTGRTPTPPTSAPERAQRSLVRTLGALRVPAARAERNPPLPTHLDRWTTRGRHRRPPRPRGPELRRRAPSPRWVPQPTPDSRRARPDARGRDRTGRRARRVARAVPVPRVRVEYDARTTRRRLPWPPPGRPR